MTTIDEIRKRNEERKRYQGNVGSVGDDIEFLLAEIDHLRLECGCYADGNVAARCAVGRAEDEVEVREWRESEDRREREEYERLREKYADNP